MEVETSEKGMPERIALHSEQGIINRRTREVPAYGEGESTYGDRTLRLIFDFLAGLFSLWLVLTALGLIGLNALGYAVSSLSLRIVVSSGLALMICIMSSPFIIPWFAVFVAAYLLLPRKSFLWNWWLCTILGSVIGVVALWIDALVWSLLSSGSSISLNVPLLIAASVPAAVLGGTICLAAAMTEHGPKRKQRQSAR